MKKEYEKHIFEYNGHEVTVIVPDSDKINGNWVWRAEFLGAFDYADRALLEKGWYIAYYKISDMYGCPESIELMKGFHDFITDKYSLNSKAAIFGFSRGGLYSTNYTLKYPDDIGVLYLDAPVLDIKSWPAGFGKGVGGAKEWEECKECYGLTEENAKAFKGNPVDRLDELEKTGVPVILVAGGSDTVVPYCENGAFLEKKYKESDVPFEVYIKPECEHHPHSLENPAPIVSFIEKYI